MLKNSNYKILVNIKIIEYRNDNTLLMNYFQNA